MIDTYEFSIKTLDTLTEQITVIDKIGNIVYVNKGWINFSENNDGIIDSDKWNNTNYLDVSDNTAAMGDAFGIEASKGIRSVISGEKEVFYLEYPCHSPNEERWFMMRVTSFKFSTDSYYVLSHQNITERKLAEKELEKSYIELKNTQNIMIAQSRQATIGEITSMLAHQWRQPLATISAITTTLSLDIMMDNYQKTFFTQKIESINELSQALSDTINNFRNFFKPNKEAEIVLINTPVIKALGVIRTSLKSDNIKITEDYTSTEKVNIYTSEMMQVILNILKNAQDNFKRKVTRNPQIKISTNNKSISICDNGSGISNDIIDKIYEPYFTTKNELNGIGLGLYMSKTIIENHHKGSIQAINTDLGVCFNIEL